jgi:hypothetical protein
MRGKASIAATMLVLLTGLVAADVDPTFFMMGGSKSAVYQGTSYLHEAKDLGATWEQIGGFAVDY